MSMEFTEDALLGRSTTTINFRGRSVYFFIDNAHPNESRTEIAKAVQEKLENSWAEIEQNLVRSLLATYNSSWADPDGGFPQLEADEFLQSIVLGSVEVKQQGDLALHFDSLFFRAWVHIHLRLDGGMSKASLTVDNDGQLSG